MAFKFKSCGCGWVDERAYNECADHAALRAQRDALLGACKEALAWAKYDAWAYFKAEANEGADPKLKKQTDAIWDAVRAAIAKCGQ